MSEVLPEEWIAENLRTIWTRMAEAAQRSGRSPSDVELIAVSKTFPAECVRAACAAGQHVFGESRLQEAEAKMDLLPGDLIWHFIGRVQRNKARRILPRFDMIHGVDSLRLAQQIDQLAAELACQPQVFLQVNIGREESKGGFDPDAFFAEALPVFELTCVNPVGLMCIPPVGQCAEDSRRWFVALRELRDRLQADSGAPLPFLSMGMSDDFEVAIEEGATHVRVGSSIFGKRAYRVDGELG
ncbi:MAG: YggS family pyridoxal phosphate-dependent enzyme [Luteolibacter sp.]